MILLLSDLELPLRGRTYRPPDRPHVAVARARDLDDLLEHLRSRADCTGAAILGPLAEQVPDLAVLKGRRLLVCAGDGAAMREWSSAGLAAGADVEWIQADAPDTDRLGAWALPVSGVVLAAGGSTRMGQNKLLMDLGGRPLIRHVMEAASEGGCHTVLVVYSDQAVAEAVGAAAACVFNPNAATGMASSLRVGLGALPEMAAGAMLLLGDQPLVGARTVEMLLRAWRREGARPAVASSYTGSSRWMPPVVIDRELWPELMRLDGDAGARQVLDAQPDLLDTVVAGGLANDVDTPQDYANVVRLFPDLRRPDPS